ncbi:MAG: macro domain-containing protein [Methylophilaceae bacterium]|nr:macro domain-containing protein [Methylophilaceae bacterium]
MDAIVNTVNCVGVMGKGIALQFKQKWPANFAFYAKVCQRGEVKIGQMLVYDSGGLLQPNFIINFPTKQHWRSASQLAWIESGLLDLVAQVRRLGIRSIAIPPLGCGNGRLDWKEVKALIKNAFEAVPEVTVYVFEPNFVLMPQAMVSNTKPPKMTAGRAAILKVLQAYKTLQYGLGKIEVQKLAYFLQEAGQELNLVFKKHKYGPYTQALPHVLLKMEGHYIHGYGDGTGEAEIVPDEQALIAADVFLAHTQDRAFKLRIERVVSLIEGFETPFGMELLATVHWLNKKEGWATLADVVKAAHNWNKRKASLMTQKTMEIAWERLQSQRWI